MGGDDLPFAAEIQQEVIKSHGFSDDGDQGNLRCLFSNSCVINNLEQKNSTNGFNSTE